MKTLLSFRLLSWCAFCVLASQLHALEANEWRYRQTLEVTNAGLVRIELPPETLNAAARPNLDDLRIVSGGGDEIPFVIERPRPQNERSLRAKILRNTLGSEGTVITLETETADLLAGVSLETPAPTFIKPVRIEASRDDVTWQELAAGETIFRTSGGTEKLRVDFTPAGWKFLRLTLDNQRAAPLPITGAKVHLAVASAPSEAFAASIKSRDESPGVTRLALDLGAANLTVAALHLDTPEALFTRKISIAVPEVLDDEIRDRPLSEGEIYRISVGDKTEARLRVPIEKPVAARELLVFIHHGDSPPLQVSAVRGERRLERAVLFASAPGTFVLLSGNRDCAAPCYDLSALGGELQNAPAQTVKPSAIAENTGYKTREALGTLNLQGASIDTGEWKFRKPIQLARAGAQQIELDLEVLSNSTDDLRDVRVISDGRQLPFLIERTSIARPIPLTANPIVDPKRPALSRWSLKLPRAELPITRLKFTSSSPLFQRDFRLWEEPENERGEKYPRELGRATWKQTPGSPARDFFMEFSARPRSDTLLLETDHGDNPAIEVGGFRCFYPATRLVFKATPDAARPLWLFYGKRNASAPHYDLGLVASELLRAEKASALLLAEEVLKPQGWRAGESSAVARAALWAVLALVVATLLVVIARMLPKTE